MLTFLASSLLHTLRLDRALAVSEQRRSEARSNARRRRRERSNCARKRGPGAPEHVYVADMRVAWQLLNDGDLASVAGVLDQHHPRSDSSLSASGPSNVAGSGLICAIPGDSNGGIWTVFVTPFASGLLRTGVKSMRWHSRHKATPCLRLASKTAVLACGRSHRAGSWDHLPYAAHPCWARTKRSPRSRPTANV